MTRCKLRVFDKKNKVLYRDISQIDYDLRTVTVRWHEKDKKARYSEISFQDAVLMQSIGSNDKNNDEIFDGDIIMIPDDRDTFGINSGESYRVIYKNGAFRLKPNYNHQHGGFVCTDEDMALVEVVGNIYENPELLSGENV